MAAATSSLAMSPSTEWGLWCTTLQTGKIEFGEIPEEKLESFLNQVQCTQLGQIKINEANLQGLEELVQIRNFSRFQKLVIEAKLDVFSVEDICRIALGQLRPRTLRAFSDWTVQDVCKERILRLVPIWIGSLKGRHVEYKSFKQAEVTTTEMTDVQKEAFKNLNLFFALGAKINDITVPSLGSLSSRQLRWVLTIIRQDRTTHLNLSGSRLRSWEKMEEWFPKLEVLILDGCTKLKSLEGLEKSPKLKTLSVVGCSSEVQEKARSLKSTQINLNVICDS